MAADTATQSHPIVPPELIDLVIDCLGGMAAGSFQALLQMSLVSKQCQHRARKYLFHHVDIGRQLFAQRNQTDGQRIQAFLDLLLENEALAVYVLSLRVRMSAFFEGPAEEEKESFRHAFPGILRRLRWLRTFVMESADLLEWDKISAGIEEAMTECCSRPTLIRLEFQGFENFPAALIFSAPSLRKISLLNVSADNTPPDTAPAAWFQSLRSLNIQNAASVIAPYALSRPTSFVGLERLGLTVNSVLDMEVLRRIVAECSTTLHSVSLLYIPYHSWGYDLFDMAFLPQLTRMSLFICPAEAQVALRCPGFVPTLIYDALSSQSNLELLSILITFRTSSFPPGQPTGFLEDQGLWKMLDEHLASSAATNLQTVILVIVVTIEGLDTEDPEDRFEELESLLMDETRSVFAANVENGRVSIDVDVRRHPRAQGSIV